MIQVLLVPIPIRRKLQAKQDRENPRQCRGGNKIKV